MNIISVLGVVAILSALVGGLEGINYLSGGDLYLASIRPLVQATEESLRAPAVEQQPQPMPPLPSLPSEPQPMPPPPPSEFQPAPQPQERMINPPPANQEIQEGRLEIAPSEVEWEEQEEFIDPREVQNVMREIKQIQSDLKRLSTQLKKITANSSLAEEVPSLLQELGNIQNVLKNSSASVTELRDAIDEFRTNNYWDRLNQIRARVEIPREIKQINSSIKRLERIIATKSVKNLGLNLERAANAIAEMKQAVQTANQELQSGNFEEAQEAMQYFHEGGHPGEIESVIMRFKEWKSRLKQIRKNAAATSEVERVLLEMKSLFDEGNYREAREAMEGENQNLTRLLYPQRQPVKK